MNAKVSRPSFLRVELLQFIRLLLQILALKIGAGLLDAKFQHGNARVNERVTYELD